MSDEALTPIDPDKVFFNDLAFICLHAEAIALLPGWRNSKGSTVDHAVGIALGRKIIEL